LERRLLSLVGVRRGREEEEEEEEEEEKRKRKRKWKRKKKRKQRKRKRKKKRKRKWKRHERKKKTEKRGREEGGRREGGGSLKEGGEIPVFVDVSIYLVVKEGDSLGLRTGPALFVFCFFSREGINFLKILIFMFENSPLFGIPATFFGFYDDPLDLVLAYIGISELGGDDGIKFLDFEL
jgi:hypothetical protein